MSAPDIPSEYTIHVNPLHLSGGVGLDMALGSDPNEPFTIAPLTINAGVTGDPNAPIAIAPLTINANAAVTGDPAQPVTVDLGLNVHLDPIEADLDVDADIDADVDVDADLDVKLEVAPLEGDFDFGLDKINACVSMAFTQIPLVRVHMPTNWAFGFSFCGLRIFDFTIAGETMLVTQDNPPRVFYQPSPPEPGGPHETVDVAYKVTLDEEEEPA